MDKKRLMRDYIIVNLAGMLGAIPMLIVIVLEELGIVPKLPCTFLETTHMYCPGCGGTRALMALAKGHIIKSLCFNPTVILGVLLIMYYEITVLMTVLSKKNRVYYTKSTKPVVIYVSIILAFFVIRNVLLVGFGIDILN